MEQKLKHHTYSGKERAQIAWGSELNVIIY